MHLSEEQLFNQALIKLAVLFYQVDRRILLSEQDYLEELVESLEWDSPICREAFVNDVIHQTRTALDTGDAADILRSLQGELSFDANRALEVAMAMSGIDGERSDEETELLSLLTHKVLARALTTSALEIPAA
ncbi:TerB family tellurite resistance protein [Alteromonas gilva]|uniref:TerB family tellurite resistance protein n=1 Tax=Alteromonas gilva TaxID=2987522 RepID=A0ABT5L6W2_9ALTE|nr:TerB family tellurite resistance protein [Alteromonas gilva]MDC8831562.1 TerB family tellurite resistance protein [Alteromonas gilva]